MLSALVSRPVSGNLGAFFLQNSIPLGAAAAIGAGVSALAFLGMFRVEKDRVVLRDTSEALSFIQELTQLLGLFEPR